MVRLKFTRHIVGLVLLIHLLFGITEAVLAAMSIDLGNEYTKIALVKPGVPMEIVLNRESQRKTQTLVSIRGQERLFGDGAANSRVRYPKDVYGCMIDLLGKKFDHPLVHLFQQRFPYYKLIPDQNRGTVLFENDDGVTYSVEELVAMLLADARFVAEKYAEQPVKDVVITVPAYFNQAERRAMVNAAEIAGVSLLQLMNDNTAAGVNYGMFRRKEFNVTATTVLIYDMGATKTTATIFDYQLVQDKITKEKNPQMTILGVGYDRTLGGIEITLRLRDYFAKVFMEQHQKKAKTDIRTNARSMTKLLKEAERVKKVLSANADHMAQVENLHEEIDFKTKISRQELDDLVLDVYERVAQPVKDALKMAEITPDKIDYVILMGGGTRSLKVQESLQAAVEGKDLGKYLNTDEAIAMGAVYQAAHRSKGFKVKKFLINDINLYPIVVDFEKENSTTDTSPARIIRRTLFGFKNHYPQKKVMTFSKHTHDFEFHVNYGELGWMSAAQSSFFGQINVSRVDLHGVGEAITNNKEEGTEYKGAKAHFRMDDGGVLHLETADVTFEKIIKEGEKDDSASTLSKLGKKLSSLFGGGDTDKKEPIGDEVEHHVHDDHKEGSEEKMKAEKPSEKKEEQKEDGAKKDSKDEPKPDSEKAKPSENETDSKANATEIEKPKPSIVKISLKMEKSFMDLPKFSEESLKESIERLKTFETYERKKLEREKSQNDLESFVLDTREKLDQNKIYQSVTTSDERQVILDKLKEASDWLEDQGLETETKEFQSKLKSLQEVCKDLTTKVNEAKDRPKAVEAINQMLNYSNIFLSGMKNLSVDDQIFSETEIGALEKLVNDTSKWWADVQIEQKKLKAHEKPVITIMSVAEKVGALDREVKYLLNKAKFTKPKAKKTSTDDAETKNETKDESKTDETDDKKDKGETKHRYEQAESMTEEEIKQEEKQKAQDEQQPLELDSGDENLNKDDEHVEL